MFTKSTKKEANNSKFKERLEKELLEEEVKNNETLDSLLNLIKTGIE